MFSFLKNLGGKKSEKLDKQLNSEFKKLKELYGYAELSEDRKEYLKSLIEENG